MAASGHSLTPEPCESLPLPGPGRSGRHPRWVPTAGDLAARSSRRTAFISTTTVGSSGSSSPPCTQPARRHLLPGGGRPRRAVGWSGVLRVAPEWILYLGGHCRARQPYRGTVAREGGTMAWRLDGTYFESSSCDAVCPWTWSALTEGNAGPVPGTFGLSRGVGRDCWSRRQRPEFRPVPGHAAGDERGQLAGGRLPG